VLALNVKSVFHLTVALLPQLAAAATTDDPARVINIGSIDGIRCRARDLRLLREQGRGAPPHARARAQARAARHHRERGRAGPFESKMMAATLEKFRDALVKTNPAQADRRRPRTWPASRSTSRRARAPT
jgi:hypothetical protein